jgi:cadmium resistance protein CadD (predicted permease)
MKMCSVAIIPSLMDINMMDFNIKTLCHDPEKVSQINSVVDTIELHQSWIKKPFTSLRRD